MELKTSKCRACGRAIVWAELEGGRRVPLDPHSVVYSVTSTEDGRYLAARLLVPESFPEIAVLTSHFATCPKTSQIMGMKKRLRAKEARTT